MATSRDKASQIQELVNKDGKHAAYVSAAIYNLEGMNIGLGRETTDVIFKEITEILLEHVQAIPGVDVIPFRLYASILAMVVVGAPAKVVRSAMERAVCEVQRYVNTIGVQDLPHPDYIGDPYRYGVGAYFGVSEIDGHSLIEDIIVRAEKERYANEKAGNRPAVNGEKLKHIVDGAKNSPDVSLPVTNEKKPFLEAIYKRANCLIREGRWIYCFVAIVIIAQIALHIYPRQAWRLFYFSEQALGLAIAVVMMVACSVMTVHAAIMVAKPKRASDRSNGLFELLIFFPAAAFFWWYFHAKLLAAFH